MDYYDIMTLPRDFTRADFYQLWRIMRKHNTLDRDDASRCAERAHIKTVLDKYVDEHGRVGVVESGMDCDCVSYCYGRVHADMTVTAFLKRRDDIYAWADGPCYVSICAPHDLPDNYSRDLALEAYEEGHPHVVYY